MKNKILNLFRESDIFLYFVLIILPPLGVLMLWITRKSKGISYKCGISVAFLLLFLTYIISNSKSTPESFFSLETENTPVVQITHYPEDEKKEQPIPSKTAVYIGASGTKYHKSSCNTLKGKGNPIEKDKAISMGYAPCSICKPDEE